MAAFGGIHRFQGEETGFVALLLTITRRRVIDELRRRSRRVPETPWSPELDGRTVGSVEDDVLGRASARDLGPHLARLTTEQREVLLLRLLADLSLEQTAEIVGKR